MTQTLIECAVRAANESHRTYSDSLKQVISIVERLTGYDVGDQFTVDQVAEEMSKYIWAKEGLQNSL